jgi:hypothetical protein
MNGIAIAWNTGVVLIAEVKGIEYSKLPALGSVCKLINSFETVYIVKNS